MLDVPVAEVKSRHIPSYTLNVYFKLGTIILETIKTELFCSPPPTSTVRWPPVSKCLYWEEKNPRDGQPSMYKHHFAFIFQTTWKIFSFFCSQRNVSVLCTKYLILVTSTGLPHKVKTGHFYWPVLSLVLDIDPVALLIMLLVQCNFKLEPFANSTKIKSARGLELKLIFNIRLTD